MARLNDASGPVDKPTDSNLDVLRKRFLRQNRDIARQNSTQGLKIRQLEFEVQRLLNENLEMRGQIYRLEHELQESKARRIADHAIEIRAKMEAQLLEWSEMLNSLGTEPPMKRRMSPVSRTIARPRQNNSTSPSQESRSRKSKEARKEAEDLAERDGRLPPIFETKTYPRRTMDGDEILALCAEAAEEEVAEDAANSSAEIGPAPTSQFIEEEPMKTDSPCRPSPVKENAILDLSASRKLFATSPSPKRQPESVHSEDASPIEVERKPVPQTNISTKLVATNPDPTPSTNDSMLKLTPELSSPNAASVAGKTPVSVPALAPPSKGKRKLSVRDDESSAVIRTTKVLSDKSPAFNLEKNGRKPIKNLLATKNREKLAQSTAIGGTQRKVLGVKNANQEISSPAKKGGKPEVFDEVAAAKADALRTATIKEPKGKGRQKGKRDAAPISIPLAEAAAPAVTSIEPEIVEPSPEGNSFPVHPASPAPSFLRGARDTPPPADISHTGETSRPSRRARAQISYAEPNLRDKMRRPSKQLVDAVSGEGKHLPRTSIKAEDLLQSSASASTRDGSVETVILAHQVPLDNDSRQKERQEAATKSPLSEKTRTILEEPTWKPHPVTTNHKRNRYSVHVGNNAAMGAQELLQLPLSQQDEVTLPPPIEPEVQAADPYDFTPSSPSTTEQSSMLSNGSSNTDEDGTKGHAINVKAKPRRASAMKIDYSGLDIEDDYMPSKSHHGGSRKRASMMAPKRSRGDLDSGYDTGATAARADESTGSGGTSNLGDGEAAGNGHSRGSMRRRSMMI